MKILNNDDFYFELIENMTLIITIPRIFTLIDLEDMKINNNIINFKFNKEICDENKINNIAKIKMKNKLNEFLSNYNNDKSLKNIFIIDIKELEKQTKGIFYLYD